MQILTTSVGRKILMAITGQLMVLFVVVHLLGNSSIFIGADGINAYAKHLHDLGPLVWVFRLGMLGLLSVHAIFGVMLTLENSAATPQAYAVKDLRKATLSSNNMIWTGLLIMLFLVYHLLQFTVRMTPDIVQGVDALGRFDVFTMVLTSFQKGSIAAIYVAAMVVLFLHLNHGIQSFFQTMGWNTDKTLPVFSKLSKVVALVFLVGYSSIPVVILTGILSK